MIIRLLNICVIIFALTSCDNKIPNDRIEDLRISIDKSELEIIKQEIELAIQVGILDKKKVSSHPSKIKYKDVICDADGRLKGHWPDHYITDKYSLRIEALEPTIEHLKSFSIHPPETRQFAGEWLFHKSAELLDISNLKFGFVDIFINDEFKGIYNYEQHFSDLENELILCFNETKLWKNKIKLNDKTNRDSSLFVSDIKVYNHQHWNTYNPVALNDAVDQLNGFKKIDSSFAQKFDLEKLGTYYALMDLLGAQHAAYWNNLVFKYDFETSLLTPISFDGNTGYETDHLLIEELKMYEADSTMHSVRVTYLWKNTDFVKQYNKSLKMLIQSKFLNQLKVFFKDEISAIEIDLKKEYPEYYFDWNNLMKNERRIINYLNTLEIE